MITAMDILTTHGKHPSHAVDVPAEVLKNASDLAHRVSLMSGSFGDERRITSGYRPRAYNEALIKAGKKAAKNSLHIWGAAVDLADDDRALAAWVMANLELFGHFGLWIEDTNYTREKQKDGTWKSWVHLQLIPPPSGRRVFKPYKGPPPR